MRPCTACAHPERAAIDAALVEGISLRTVAARHDLSAGALHRHRTRHVDQPTVGEIRGPDHWNRWWSQWDGVKWVPIEKPNLADLIELRRPEHAEYRKGFWPVGDTAAYIILARNVYRLRKHPRRDVDK